MTVYDSSVVIDYLDGESAAVDYVEHQQNRRAVAPQLVLFEVYQGELFKSGPPDFDAIDDALDWLAVVEDPSGIARAAAELQNQLHESGDLLAARDAFVAGTARRLGEPLAVADSDFDVDGIDELLDIDFV
ncbi:PIN domain-containing protein [Halosimplex pelagicum]|uniref:PIN domain-containing protein n=1 Tax=Halosimplex pelagicum TaxID=869886 RepID=A0A7D5T934_9EURY|nr:PIN domain-containing protein [Halosimplex pelagicum]QLH81530.1 PIN domain-containing protein [Halosimplex pelagicum]